MYRVSHAARYLRAGPFPRGSPPNHAGIFRCYPEFGIASIDVTVIALWLGHEQTSTTNIYLHADMSRKERAIARTNPPTTTPGRYRPPDALLAFLEAL
jgi:hypothetical protein